MAHDHPSQIGRYQILDVLGEGAMGVVYRARDTVLDRALAVKVMSQPIAADPDLRERFLREARAAGALQHPNVVTIYDFGETEGHLFIAMELVPGVDLSHILTNAGPLPLDTKLAVVSGVLSGLAYAHKRGVVHRDVKPANVRVSSDGTVKIMDFGIAHLASSQLTHTGMTMGTPSYMAPEQVDGGQISPATDIFAAGVVLYELLAGVKPFVGPTLPSVLFKIVSEEPADVFTGVPGIPSALPAIVFRALAKSPHDRYRDALAMAHDLDRVRSELSNSGGAITLSAAVASATTSGFGPAARPRSAPSRPPTPTVPRPAPAPRAPAAMAAAAVAPRVPMSAVRRRAAVGVALTAVVIGVGVTIAHRGGGGAPVQTAGRTAPDDAAGAAPLAGAPVASRSATGAASPSASTSSAPTASAPSPNASSPSLGAGALDGSRAEPVLPSDAPASGSVPTGGTRGARGAAAPSARTPAGAPAIAAPRTGARSEAATVTPPTVAPPTVAPRAGDTGGARTPVLPSAPAIPAPAPPTAPASASAPATPPGAAPAPSAAGVGDAVRAYARAIESRDISAVQRVYPGITSAQRHGFEQFFDAARSIHVQFALSGVDVSGVSAEARLAGTYEYVTEDGRAQRQPVNFTATLHHDGTAWRLVSVR